MRNIGLLLTAVGFLGLATGCQELSGTKKNESPKKSAAKKVEPSKDEKSPADAENKAHADEQEDVPADGEGNEGVAE